MSKQRARAALSARKFLKTLDDRFQRRSYQTEAVVTGVVRDGAERATRVLATIDGVGSQRVAIDHGAPYSAGDVLLVENAGTATMPRWSAVRKLQSVEAIPNIDPNPTLPTPSGLSLETGHWEPEPGGGMKAWVYVEWLSIGDAFGYVGYDVAYKTNDQLDPSVRQIVDMRPTTLTAESLVTGSTLIPRDAATSSYDFPKFGRLQIEAEKIDYTAVTDGDPETGVGGVGALQSFTVSGAGWTADEWVNYCLVDSANARFLITANTAEVLTLYSGTPANGAYAIRPCFSICTRGVGGTAAAAHAVDKTIKALSVGVMLDGLQPDIDYNVRVRAHRMDGAVSAWTAWASIQTDIDTEAPPAPTGFAVTNQVGGVVLSWTGPTQDVVKDLAGFHIYRASSSAGTGATLIKTVGVRTETFWEMYPPGTTGYFNATAFDSSGNESGYAAATWVLGRSLLETGYNIAINADLERDWNGDNWPDWVCWGNLGVSLGTVAYGAYGFIGGKGIRVTLANTKRMDVGHDPYGGYVPGSECPIYKPRGENARWTFSCYVKPSCSASLVQYDGDTGASGKLVVICNVFMVDEYSGTHTEGLVTYKLLDLADDWIRVAGTAYEGNWPPEPIAPYGMAFRLELYNNTGVSVTVDVDRFQLEMGETPSDWQPCLSTGTEGLLVDAGGVVSSNFSLDESGKLYSTLVPGDSSKDLGSTTLPWRDVIASRDGRFGGGLMVGSSTQDPGTGELAIYNSSASVSMYLKNDNYTQRITGSYSVNGILINYGNAEGTIYNGNIYYYGGTTSTKVALYNDGDVRLVGGLSVGSVGTNVAAGDILATGYGTFAGGLGIGSTTPSPGTNFLTLTGSGGYIQRICGANTSDNLMLNYGDGGDLTYYGGGTGRQFVVSIGGDVSTIGGLSVGALGATTNGDILYTSNLRPYRNSTAYTAYAVVPCSPALTHYDWDGDNKTVGTHTIDTSAVFGVPAGARGVFIRLLARWASRSDSYSVNARASGASTGSAVACQCSQAVADNKYIEQDGFCPCDANGDIEIVVVGLLATVIVQIVGYIL